MAAPKPPSTDGYDASQILNLAPRDQVRLRPSSYVGGTGNSALAHLVDELLANSADEALGGYCSNVWVDIDVRGGISVRDDGRGVPIGETKLASTGKMIPTPQAAFTEMFTGGKYDDTAYSSSGGMNGMGAKAVAYLSKEMSIDIKRDGKRYRQVFRNGAYGTKDDKFIIDKPIIEAYAGADRGTAVTFLYDDTVFDADVRLDGERIARKCYNLSRLVPGLQLHFADARSGDKETFVSKVGIPDLVADLNEGEQPLFKEIVHVSDERMVEDANKQPVRLRVEVAFQPAATDSPEERGAAFTNLIHQPDGGTHVSGFRKGLARALNDHFRKVGLLKGTDGGFEGSDVMSGLAFTISMRTNVAALQFESQTKKYLTSSWVDSAVAAIVDDTVLIWLTDHPSQAKSWFTYVTEVKKNRERMLAERRAVKAKIGSGGGLDPLLKGLVRETTKDTSKTEIYFVEGDSAGGSAKQGRDRATQAVLPFRGKMLNVLKASEKNRADARKKLLENEDVRRIATALETGLGIHFDIERLRYNKVILMADADADGGHIVFLWLTALWLMFPEVVRHGHVYLSIPPLYSVYDRKAKKRAYYYNERDLNTALKGRPRESYTLTRFKGLGEMQAEHLAETAMNPGTRRIRQIVIADVAETKKIIEDLMGGNNADKRRAFMDEHCRGKNTREAVELGAVAA